MVRFNIGYTIITSADWNLYEKPSHINEPTDEIRFIETLTLYFVPRFKSCFVTYLHHRIDEINIVDDNLI